ncbi:MAG: flavin-containing monooxygenase [Panacagrimonas sp.]
MNETERYDAIVIGAGISGMYMLHRLRGLGLRTRVYETGDGVGGTWYWNRYPGARFDSESYSYGYSFSDEILREWQWKEHFSPQPDNERYLNFVADKLDLGRDIQFNSRVTAAHYREVENLWDVQLEDGRHAQARYLISATGPLSAHVMPKIEGIDSFKGQSCHTARWPKTPVDLRGKRVGVIGTGATGVQVIQEVAKVAGQLTVFQLDPNWCAPLNNAPITEAEQKDIQKRYPEIFQACASSFGGFIHNFQSRPFAEVPREERLALYEKLYNGRGFGIWLGNFMETLMDPAANAEISEFIAGKIRARVKDPTIADKLIPKTHGFGTKRVPMETRYYEVYNQDNVELVHLPDNPIERITPAGVKTRDREYPLDILVYATGFDAVTGALKRIDIRGRGGQALKDKWNNGPQTYLGLQIAGFPNFFTLVGPHNAASFCNIPRCIEQNVEWVAGCLANLIKADKQRIETTETAERDWTAHAYEVTQGLLFSQDAWFFDKSAADGQPRFLVYVGGTPAYRMKCDEVAAKGYEGFVIS